MQKKQYDTPFDASKWTPSQDRDASAKSTEAACSFLATCIFSEADLPHGQTLFGMKFPTKAAFYQYFRELEGRENKPLPSQAEVAIVWEIVNLNKQKEIPKGKQYAPFLEVIDYAANRELLAKAFPGLLESIQLEKPNSSAKTQKLEAHNKELEDKLLEMELKIELMLKQQHEPAAKKKAS